MRSSTPRVSYLVGTPKGKLSTLEQSLLKRDWQQARPSVRVKLLPHDGETYVLAESQDRVMKERSMRRRRLRKYLDALQAIAERKRPMQRDALHQAIGAAKKEAGRDARFAILEVTHRGSGKRQTATLSYRLDRAKLREAWRREGRYLLRTNMTDTDPAKLWQFYLQLTEVEQAFKELKSDLAIRPIHHQLDHRIEAHIFVSFMAYALQVTLKTRLKHSASGLTPRAALEKFATLQMLDVQLIHSPPARSPLRGSLRLSISLRSVAHHRRPRDPHVTLHSAGEGPATAARPTEADPPGSASAQDHRADTRLTPSCSPHETAAPVVQTFAHRPRNDRPQRLNYPTNPRSRVNHALQEARDPAWIRG